jgi:hypothetical protein
MTSDHANAGGSSLSDSTDRAKLDTCDFGGRPAGPASYLVRHWRGELSLGLSFWVNGILALFGPRLLFAMLIAMPAAWSDHADGVRQVAWAWTVIFALWIVLLVWANVGIWRSAGRHTARGGQRRWARSAKLVVMVAVLLETLFVAVVASSPRFDIVRIALGRDPDGHAVITVGADGKTVLVHGVFGVGFATELTEVLHASVGVRTVVLHSRGGRVYEAVSAAKQIRALHLDTRAVGQCDSACTILFLAGRERSAAADTTFTFHKASSPGVNAQDEWLEANLTVFRAAGLSPAFLERYRALREGELWVPSYAELIAYNVITSSAVHRP